MGEIALAWLVIFLPTGDVQIVPQPDVIACVETAAKAANTACMVEREVACPDPVSFVRPASD